MSFSGDASAFKAAASAVDGWAVDEVAVDGPAVDELAVAGRAVDELAVEGPLSCCSICCLIIRSACMAL